MKKKYKLTILANENPYDHELWINACEAHLSDVEYRLVDLTRSDWLDRILGIDTDCFLARPTALRAAYKQLYDERVYIINRVLGLPIYPSLEEMLIYENKRMLSYWLKANNVPHPKTYVFYYKDEAINYIQETDFPIVAKLNLGASGDGVRILESKSEARSYIKRAFSCGIAPRTGPKISSGHLIERAIRYLRDLKALRYKLSIYGAVSREKQKGFLLFQEYVPHSFEWRCVRIGESFFTHKKIVKGRKASGTLRKRYERPSSNLLNFVKLVTDKRDFLSQAVDIFEVDADSFLVNEMQTIFGQSDPYQMLIDGIPGRYILKGNNWIFEEGNFNVNESYDLRIRHVICLLKDKRIL